jgi:hypothetical protein
MEYLLNSLPRLSTSNIPSEVQSFSSAFIRENIGGTKLTFSRVGTPMVHKQIVRWPELIRINPEAHEYAPYLGSSYGTVTLVEGRFIEDRDPCNTGAVYPGILRRAKDDCEYIGHYKILSWEQVLVGVWKSWSKQRRDSVVKGFDSKWGDEVLLQNGLQVLDEWQDSRHQQIHRFFERESKPHLRMVWAILPFHEFNRRDYSALVSKALKGAVRRTPFPETCFETTFNKWMGSYVSIVEPFRLATKERQKLSDAVLCRGDDSGMFGKDYRRGPLKA